MIRRTFLNSLMLSSAGLMLEGKTGKHLPPKTSGPVSVSPRVLALHKKAIIIDGHNDSLIEHWARKESYDLGRELPAYHADLRRMREGGLTAMNSMVGDSDLVQGIELWAGMHENLEGHPADFLLMNDPSDIERAKSEGKIALIGQLEGCGLLHNSLKVLQEMHRLGVRVAGLTHGQGGGEFDLQGTKSLFGFCTPSDRDRARREMKGLTEFGRATVRECNRLGIVVDVVHTNDAAFYEAIELSQTPVQFSHGAVFALSPHWRNLTDDQLKALAANGGVIGIAPYPDFIDPLPEKGTLRRVVDHIEYVCERIGDDYVGFGSDYDGTPKPLIVPSYAETPRLTQLMLDRGFREETILKFWGGNFLRVLRKAKVPAA
jgi:membrane dipeptidase